MGPRAKKLWIWVLPPIAAIAFFAVATFFFYDGTYEPPPGAKVAVEQITLPDYASASFTRPQSVRRGVFLLDNAHGNDFDESDLEVLFARVASRGYSVEFAVNRSLLNFQSSGSRDALEERLRKADSFAVIVPKIAFTPDEARIVADWVAKGGKLLLIGDPGRRNRINTVADTFGVLFQEGYLYNTADHVLNFKNILVRDFRPDELTDGLETIALFTAGSIKSTGAPLAFADTNTLSSMVERVEPFSPLVKSRDGQVVAISDLTFLRPPQNTTLDNDRLVSNIADFLTTGQRSFDLADFPYFFRGDVNILLGRASLFSSAALLKSLLSESQIVSEVRGVEDLTKDTVFLGLYDDSAAVTQYLDVAGVQVGESLRTPFTPDIDIEGSGLILLHQGRDRQVLVVMSHHETGIRRLLSELVDDTFRSGLVGAAMGVYRMP